ncbi:hypothetical protein ALC53_11493 [Atta colombica]|uniref:Uncharacterized protein n=1 Tax=Atta colombica TaxID=520822 RepID=A0A195B0N9_9HYME|nr:hypothetical protein ALC53_11493 [Atta colombica]
MLVLMAGGDGYGRMVVVPTFAFNVALRVAAMGLLRSRDDQQLPVISANGATWSAGLFYPILWIASENHIEPVYVSTR